MRCGPHGCGEHGGRRSRARRAVEAALQQWHTVRGHRLSEKSELPRKPRCQAWHAPGGLDLRPPARLASARPACGHSLARGSRGVASGPMGAHRGGEADPRQTSPSTYSGRPASASTRATPETDRVPTRIVKEPAGRGLPAGRVCGCVGMGVWGCARSRAAPSSPIAKQGRWGEAVPASRRRTARDRNPRELCAAVAAIRNMADFVCSGVLGEPALPRRLPVWR